MQKLAKMLMGLALCLVFAGLMLLVVQGFALLPASQKVALCGLVLLVDIAAFVLIRRVLRRV